MNLKITTNVRATMNLFKIAGVFVLFCVSSYADALAFAAW